MRSNCAADQHLCFPYIASTITLLPNSEIFKSLLLSSVVVQPGFCRTWSETPKTCSLASRLICFILFYQRTNKLCKELKKVIPNIHLLYRRALNLKKIIPQALAKDFTDIIVINEDRRIPSILCVTVLHLNRCMAKQSI